ncbi:MULTISPECIES: CocE/NonD family hydrolase [unclassified Bradyrhizobium]|nr:MULTISPECIES: CocE/NonD family hydrolase [unclassified Bradyrhizobium]MBR1260846.1 prolyl oligopeptidase family serine peptidase [Bradyrhizobium sp. U87765 SZCCT0134]
MLRVCGRPSLSPFRRFAGLGWTIAAALAVAAPARAEGVRTDQLTIPAVIAGAGSGTVRLEGIVVRPDDGAPHPLAIINHGSPRDGNDRPNMSPFRMWTQASWFARRGWTAVAFLRRGYGQSPGGWAETYGPCSRPDYATAGLAGANDIAAVARALEAQPFVSKGRWISVGVSAGGFATVALTSQQPPGLVAAISFAPGRGSSGPDAVCGEPQLVAAFAQYGKTSRVPLLWVSAENDHFFGPRLTTQLSEAFNGAGGHATLVRTPPIGADGHELFGAADGPRIWTPIVETFLRANSLELRSTPIAVTRPNVAPPASLGAGGRAAFNTYLDSGPNKAFAVSGSHFGWASGRRSPDQAREDALEFCNANASDCAVVNVNDRAGK